MEEIPINNTGWFAVVTIYTFFFVIVTVLFRRSIARLLKRREASDRRSRRRLLDAAACYFCAGLLAIGILIAIERGEAPRSVAIGQEEVVLNYRWSAVRLPYTTIKDIKYEVSKGRGGTRDHILLIESDTGPFRVWANSRHLSEVANVERVYEELQRRIGFGAS